MKKRLTVGLMAVALVLGLGLQAKAQTIDEILAKSIEAQGGKDVLSKIKDTTTSGTMELIQMGMSAALTIYQKEPDKMRMDIDVMGMLITQAYDGKKGWFTNPQTGVTEEMTEQQSQAQRLQAMGYDAALNPEKYGITYVLKGKEKIGDKDCFVVEQNFKDGFKATVYINASTYLTEKAVSKSDAMGTEIESESVMSDYRKVDGIMVPFALTIFQGGAEFGRVTVTKVAFNQNLEDAFFQMR
ncbi:MAG: hypothetical protein JW843_07830 [Candidatus Aminicenantes bacterium]|nr:hypothetical protein [Candidatus Aminicenantes bacterium]